MKKIYLNLLILFTSTTFIGQRQINIRANESALIINDTCIYSNKIVYYNQFNHFKKVFINENFLKIKIDKSQFDYLIVGKGITFGYKQKKPFGPPLISVIYSLDTAWYKTFFKEKYKVIGKYNGSLKILNHLISENTTVLELKKDPVFSEYFNKKQEYNYSEIKIEDKEIYYFIYFTGMQDDSKVKSVSIEYFYR